MKEFTGTSVVGEVIFALESYDSLRDEVQPLLTLHWKEVAKDQDLMRLDPNEDYYRACDKDKDMVFVTARHAGRLIGYMAWLLYNHPHYKTVKCAQGDVHFLLPEYRRGMNGYSLLKNAIRLVKQYGAQYCYIREKIGHEHPAIMQRLGFQRLDITWSCNLTKDPS